MKIVCVLLLLSLSSNLFGLKIVNHTSSRLNLIFRNHSTIQATVPVQEDTEVSIRPDNYKVEVVTGDVSHKQIVNIPRTELNDQNVIVIDEESSRYGGYNYSYKIQQEGKKLSPVDLDKINRTIEKYSEKSKKFSDDLKQMSLRQSADLTKIEEIEKQIDETLKDIEYEHQHLEAIAPMSTELAKIEKIIKDLHTSRDRAQGELEAKEGVILQDLGVKDFNAKPYEILHVNANPTYEDVERAYKQLSAFWDEVGRSDKSRQKNAIIYIDKAYRDLRSSPHARSKGLQQDLENDLRMIEGDYSRIKFLASVDKSAASHEFKDVLEKDVALGKNMINEFTSLQLRYVRSGSLSDTMKLGTIANVAKWSKSSYFEKYKNNAIEVSRHAYDIISDATGVHIDKNSSQEEVERAQDIFNARQHSMSTDDGFLVRELFSLIKSKALRETYELFVENDTRGIDRLQLSKLEFDHIENLNTSTAEVKAELEDLKRRLR